MWWPSFLSVILDLWGFVLGERSISSVQNDPAKDIGRQVDRAAERVEAHAASAPVLIELQVNEHYKAAHEDTESIRSYLKDEAHVPTMDDDLTSYEWLAYTFSKHNRSLPWSSLSMVSVGYWHQAVKGLSDVSISVAPRTRSIIEWFDARGFGHIGLVKKVTPDETILILELGGQASGMLSERLLPVSQWKEMRPVFISLG